MDEEDEVEGSEGSEGSGVEDDDGSELEDEESGSDDPLGSSDEELDGEALESEDGTDSDASSSSSTKSTAAQRARKRAFFSPTPADPSGAAALAHTSFLTMNLSRPLLKALSALGFTAPTPIQAATIPVALLGKDVVGNAVTGSGKTAAFVVPVLERLMYRERGRKADAVRCVVLVPTRELGVQCCEVARKLSAFTDVRIALVVGVWYLAT